MREHVLCAADLPVCLPLGGTVCSVAMEMPAKEWADRLGIAWDTVRQRRYRGDSWSEAFQPYLRRTPFNSPTALPARQRKQLTINGALQMKKLEVSVPALAHVIVTGVPDGAKAAVLRRFQEVLQEEFGAAVSIAPTKDGLAYNPSDVQEALWMLSSA